MSRRILLLSTYSGGGGAANATKRLYWALRAEGIEVRMLTLYGDSGDEDEGITSVYQGVFGRGYAFLLKALERLDLIRSNGYITNPLWRFSPASRGVDISSHPWVLWADIIHLHWVNQGFLSLSSLHKLQALHKPLVWTLHDIWAVTGGCHIPFVFLSESTVPCRALSTACEQCPLLGVKANRQSYSQRMCEAKRSLHSKQMPIHFIAVSEQEGKLFDRSYLRRGLECCSVIAPPMSRLLPIEEQTAVTIDGYTPDIDYIVVVAARLDDEVKGWNLLRQTLRMLRRLYKEEDVYPQLILVGEVKNKALLQDMPLKTHSLGRCTSSELAYIYSSVASVTLSTSLFETFGQSLTESLGYGTPVVAFDSGGPADIIQNGSNGYLIEAYDTTHMAESIYRLLYDKRKMGVFNAATCRASINRFLPSVVAQAHLRVYDSISTMVSKSTQG